MDKEIRNTSEWMKPENLRWAAYPIEVSGNTVSGSVKCYAVLEI